MNMLQDHRTVRRRTITCPAAVSDGLTSYTGLNTTRLRQAYEQLCQSAVRNTFGIDTCYTTMLTHNRGWPAACCVLAPSAVLV
jgi:hypothetical protein